MKKSFVQKTLPNKLEIIVSPMEHSKTATVLIMVGAGSRYEEQRTNGLSHFLEHMAFKGTTKRPSAFAISSEIDSIGGEFNAYTSKDHTAFYIKALSSHADQIIDVLSDMLLHSLFNKDEIEREKGVITEEINMYEDLPMRKIGDYFETLLYGDHPLGWDIAGTRETVAGVTREDFLSYVDAVYAPNNCVVGISGGIDSDHMIKTVTEKLSGWGMRKTHVAPLFTNDKNPHNKPQVMVVSKKTQQAHLALGVRAYELNHPKRYAQSVLTAILGGGMSSRLFIEVRERRGLCYYVRSETSRYSDVGNFVVTAGVDVKRIDDAITVILAELSKIADSKQHGITKEELNKAKEYMKGHMLLELEDSRSVAALYATQYMLQGKITTPQEVIQKIDAVTIEDCVDVAHEMFTNDKLNLAVVGPYEDKNRFGKLLQF